MNDINKINTSTEDGKMLLAAVAKITTESQTNKTPSQVMRQITRLKNKMCWPIIPI